MVVLSCASGNAVPTPPTAGLIVIIRIIRIFRVGVFRLVHGGRLRGDLVDKRPSVPDRFRRLGGIA